MPYYPERYEIVRYEFGSTALMRVLHNDPSNPTRYYGTQYFGGACGAYLNNIRPATPDEKKKFIDQEFTNLRQNIAAQRTETIGSLIRQAGTWAEWCFPNSNPHGCAEHMLEEAQEVLDKMKSNAKMEDTAEEIADVFLVLCHICWKLNINLGYEAKKKLLININREWETEPNAKGYFKHKES